MHAIQFFDKRPFVAVLGALLAFLAAQPAHADTSTEDGEAVRCALVKPTDDDTISILGREIEARIASLREINWDTMGFNFVIVFAPGALAGLDRMAEGVAEVQDRPQARFAFVLAHHPRLDLATAPHRMGKRAGVIFLFGMAVTMGWRGVRRGTARGGRAARPRHRMVCDNEQAPLGRSGAWAARHPPGLGGEDQAHANPTEGDTSDTSNIWCRAREPSIPAGLRVEGDRIARAKK